MREQPEPEEGREPAPWWMWAAAVVAIFVGGFYLGRHGGVFAPVAHVGFKQPAVAPTGAAAPPSVSGSQVYMARCSSCHGATGLGNPPVFPPLLNSKWVTGKPEVLVKIVLHGMSGPVEVGGTVYNGVMPAWRDQLSDAEIVAVAGYARQMGTNSASAVDEQLVKRLKTETAARTAPWTSAELEAVP